MLTIPASIALGIAAEPIISVLFERHSLDRKPADNQDDNESIAGDADEAKQVADALPEVREQPGDAAAPASHRPAHRETTPRTSSQTEAAI